MAHLATAAVPDDLGLRRDHIVPADERGPGFDDNYDFRTLFYDAFHLPREGRLALIAPRLLNLERIFRTGEIRLDGRRAGPARILRRRRYDVVLVPAAERAGGARPVLRRLERDGGAAAGRGRLFCGAQLRDDGVARQSPALDPRLGALPRPRARRRRDAVLRQRLARLRPGRRCSTPSPGSRGSPSCGW